MYDDLKTCSECGGKCCKRMPGAAIPEDFKDLNEIRKALDSGRWAVDWWDGDPRDGKDDVTRGLYVRPATKGKEGELFDPSWGGECTFLTEDGCVLESNKRPAQCEFLKPNKTFNCKCTQYGGKDECSIAWEKHWNFLENYKTNFYR